MSLIRSAHQGEEDMLKLRRLGGELLRTSEARANQFNLRCLTVLSGFAVFCELCNRLGIFAVEPTTMTIGVVGAMFFFLLPGAIWLFNDKLRKKPSILLRSSFKLLIVLAGYLGICVTCVVLTLHTVILLVLPGILAAQYADRRTLRKWIVLGTFLLAPLNVYGGFFFGMPDRNFFPGLTGRDMLTMAQRLAVLTPKRAMELFLHYVLPRFLSIMIINALLAQIGNRNARMLLTQMELSEQAAEEMRRRNAIQGKVIEDLSAVIETRDESTGGHVLRTKQYVHILAEAMAKDDKFKDQLSEELIREIELAAPLHDVGKIAVSDTILLKPGKLTPEEFEQIKLHTVKGRAMALNIFSNLEDASFLRLAEQIAYCHHERWDGTGYPQGLKGEQIPLAARIMAVADVYDALTTDRVYKKAMPKQEALQIIYEESGTHFDPDIIRILKTIEDKI